jgi:hypothetical protein
MMGLDLETADVRLEFWQRLLCEEAVRVIEVDRDLLRLARDGAMREKMAYVLLRACVMAAEEMTPAMRRNLRAALIHWLSSTGSAPDSARQEPVDPGELRTIVGRRLTWAESARLVGGNPDDYSAYRRLVDHLQDVVRAEWESAFGSPCPFAGKE